jgi:phosphoribosylaminoimidazole-succinocarboxamide synthase
MGSVKDLEIIKEPTEKEMGVGRFHFSDRYSVFDWGEMPDLVQDKGAALCVMGGYCFEKLEEKGIKTHYRGLVDRDGRLITTDDLKEPTDIMEIDLVRVIHLRITQDGYDYSVYGPDLVNFLIPLEIIYRNSLPKGSSILKRLENKEILPQEIGLDHMPKEGEALIHPIFDISTKLEAQDRYLTFDEAKGISGLSDNELHEIKKRLNEINDLITRIGEKVGLRNEDGKVEFAFNHKRELVVVDVIGTLDECRFTYKGVDVSKEVLREYYKRTQWFYDLLEAKKEAVAKGVEDWRPLCPSQPPPLDERLLKIVSEMYKAAANGWIESELFDVSPLPSVMEEYRDYLEKGESRNF